MKDPSQLAKPGQKGPAIDDLGEDNDLQKRIDAARARRTRERQRNRKELPNDAYAPEAEPEAKQNQEEVSDVAPEAPSNPKLIRLRDQLADPNPEKRIEAFVEAQAVLPRWQLADLLPPLLNDSVKAIKVLAAMTLAAEGNEDAIAILIDLAKNDGDVKMREAAVGALGSVMASAHPEVVAALVQIVCDGKQPLDVRVMTLGALNVMGRPDAAGPALKKILRDKKEDVDLRALAVVGMPVDMLVTLLEDPDPFVRVAVARVLTGSDLGSAIGALEKVLCDGSAPVEVRIFAVDALEEIHRAVGIDESEGSQAARRLADQPKTPDALRKRIKKWLKKS